MAIDTKFSNDICVNCLSHVKTLQLCNGICAVHSRCSTCRKKLVSLRVKNHFTQKAGGETQVHTHYTARHGTRKHWRTLHEGTDWTTDRSNKNNHHDNSNNNNHPFTRRQTGFLHNASASKLVNSSKVLPLKNWHWPGNGVSKKLFNRCARQVARQTLVCESECA